MFTSARALSKTDCDSAYNFGKMISNAGFDLIFGGATSHSMARSLARGVHANGGSSVSIIPTCFDWSMGDELGETITVRDMAERKRTMLVMADAFVVLKGGLGTLDELLEMWTIKTYGGHKKPILIHTTPEYKAALIQLFQVMVDEGTASQSDWDALEWHHSSDTMIEKLKAALM